MATAFQVTFDCLDPDRMARFWAGALGYQVQPPPEGYASWEDLLRDMGVPEDEWDRASAAVDPEGKGPRLYFQKVSEPKVIKNRVHLDVNAGAGVSDPEARRAQVNAAVERLIGEGARKWYAGEQHGEYWVVMQDPEGNEFCVQ